MRLFFLVLTGFLLSAAYARAADLSVISGGAVRAGLTAAVAAYETETGRKVAVTFNATPQIKKRLAAGEVFDVVIAPPGAIEGFAKAGLVEAGPATVGRVGAGVAVRPGAPVPDIATSDDVKQAVLEAESVVFNRASSGQYIEKLFKNMGVWDRVEAKTTRYPRSRDVMAHLLEGTGAEIGFGPITEILSHKDAGLVLVGPLPEEIQKLRAYQAVPMTAGTRKHRARQFVDFLVGPEGKPLFAAAGIR